MIGIVIVSHSKQLADGLKELADAMSQEPVPIVSAGGIDDPDAPLGTDAVRIMDAIQEVMDDKGVLVFSDLGSAKLNAEMALDLLDDAEREKVTLCDAPLVEGVLAATVQIASGGDVASAVSEAREAARSFIDEAVSTGSEDAGEGANAETREFRIKTVHGLHARPAALFVQTVNRFDGPVRLTNITKSKPAANAKSINGVMLSEVGGNDVIRVAAEPSVARDLFGAIDELVASNFGEAERAPDVEESKPAEQPEAVEVKTLTSGTLKGALIARGFAHGPLRQVRRALPDSLEPRSVEDPDTEIARFRKALASAEDELKTALDAKGDGIAAYDRKIFDAHIAFLHDPALSEPVETGISARKVAADALWRDAVEDLSGSYRGLADPILKARGEDVIDVGLRVLGHLKGGERDSGASDKPAILAFDDLRPSDVLTLDTDKVLGIAAAYGGKTSHAGILASGLPIPVVFGLGIDLTGIAEGTDVLLDGGKGEMTIAPDADLLKRIEGERERLEKRRADAQAVKDEPAVTGDGERIRAAANLASLEELSAVASSGAEEVGLLRTEFLFMRREAAPSEDEQYDIYRQMVEGLGGGALTIRTVDIGGDKPVAYMDRPVEENPNLGWRGIRYSLDEPEMFETQLAAILRASAHGPVRIMFPLVSTLEEVKAGKAAVEKAKAALKARGEEFDEKIEVGIMIEVPAAAETAPLLASHVDFFSIGTNDLTQYVMATDRANPKVQGLGDPFHPAVLSMIAKSIAAAHDAGIWIGMCGAMAGDSEAVPLLLGLGLDEFSMAAADVAEFKLTVKSLKRTECEALAKKALTLDSAKAVRDLVAGNA